MAELDVVKNFLSKDLRIDMRKKFDAFREINITHNISKNAEGSVMVELGETQVLVGVKFGVDKPFPDSADQGILITNAEFSPMASPDFEPGPPREDAIELARVVDRGLRESGAIDFKSMCIEKGEKVWVLFVDVYIRNNAGNLIDAAALGAIVALNDAFFPVYDEKEGKVEFGTISKKKLKLNFIPIACTFALVDGKLLIDPSIDEEECTDARLTVTVSKDSIHSLQKGGDKGLSKDQINECISRSFNAADDIRKKLKL